MDAARIGALRAQGRSGRKITLDTGVSKELRSGPAAVCPQTYELQLSLNQSAVISKSS